MKAIYPNVLLISLTGIDVYILDGKFLTRLLESSLPFCRVNRMVLSVSIHHERVKAQKILCIVKVPGIDDTSNLFRDGLLY